RLHVPRLGEGAGLARVDVHDGREPDPVLVGAQRAGVRGCDPSGADNSGTVPVMSHGLASLSVVRGASGVRRHRRKITYSGESASGWAARQVGWTARHVSWRRRTWLAGQGPGQRALTLAPGTSTPATVSLVRRPEPSPGVSARRIASAPISSNGT